MSTSETGVFDDDVPSAPVLTAQEVGAEATTPEVEAGTATEADAPDRGESHSRSQIAERLAGLEASVETLVAESRNYHQRAARREMLIDKLHAEVEKFRAGERRSLLRPLLSEVARIRDDLLRQAETLPADFNALKAGLLLQSFAASLEFALEDNGVKAFVPEVGDAFEPRTHRAVGRVPADNLTQTNTVASVRAPGYRDLETGQVISSAQVVLRMKQELPNESLTPTHTSTPVPPPQPASVEPRTADGTDGPSSDGGTIALQTE